MWGTPANEVRKPCGSLFLSPPRRELDEVCSLKDCQTAGAGLNLTDKDGEVDFMYRCTGTSKNSKLALQDVFYVHYNSLYCVGTGCHLVKRPTKNYWSASHLYPSSFF